METDRRALLAVNAGSSSIKCALFSFEREPVLLARRAIAGSDGQAISELIAWIDAHTLAFRLAAVGHRIVHGGLQHREAERITTAVRDDLTCLVPFAPNHLPQEIALVEALEGHRPGLPHVACFDTAFHQRMPEVARRLAIPAVFDARGVRRYGFHGLSYAFLIEELARIAGDEARSRVILAHLGNGSSLTAVRDAVGIDTTMAFTPIGGVVMSTRSGDLDPGVVTYLARSERLSADELEAVLSNQSGLLGISETTGDMQELLAREQTDALAQLAVQSYIYSIMKAVGALAAALHGLDTLVFSGGIGEHAAVVRARICEPFAFLGLDLDRDANNRHADVISTRDSRVVVRVIPTNEELMIARATHRVIAVE